MTRSIIGIDDSAQRRFLAATEEADKQLSVAEYMEPTKKFMLNLLGPDVDGHFEWWLEEVLGPGVTRRQKCVASWSGDVTR